MPAIEFPFSAHSLPSSDVYPDGHIAYRPVVICTITASNGESVRFQAIVDTGADSCVFPNSVARLLKLDLDTLPGASTSGVGSSKNATRFAIVTIDLGDGIIFDAYTGFTPGLESIGVGLLGQDGFFENFDVAFSHKRKVFTVHLAE